MRNQPPKAFVYIMRDIVQMVSDELLPTLKEKCPDIKCDDLNYQYGSWAEIQGKLIQWSKDENKRYQKFPMIVLLEDYPIQIASNSDYRKATVSIFICCATQNNLESFQRQVVSFDNILEPLYSCLLKNILANPYTVAIDPIKDLPHTKINRKQFGANNIYSGAVNPSGVTDYIDAIELKNLQITLKHQAK